MTSGLPKHKLNAYPLLKHYEALVKNKGNRHHKTNLPCPANERISSTSK